MRRAVAFLLVAALGATGAQTDDVAASQAADKRFLWSVTSGDGPRSYLMGSLHVLTPEYYPLHPAIEAAFAASTVLIEEIDLDEVAGPAMVQAVLPKAMLTDGRTLDQVIAPDLYRALVAKAESAGLPLVALRLMKPWMAAMSITMPALQAAGFDPALGLDRHFFALAKTRGIERRGLETVGYQIDRLDQMSAPMQEALLRSSLEEIDTQIAGVKTLAAAWARGDTDVLAAELLGTLREAPGLYERLIVERNRNWVAPVERCLTEKTACFVVVGAAHLVGPHSLVALLAAKGYKVEQLTQPLAPVQAAMPARLSATGQARPARERFRRAVVAPRNIAAPVVWHALCCE